MKEVNKNRKEEVLSHHSEVNIDEIWAAIEPQVDLINAEKKRKKRFFFFFLFGAMLLAGSSLYIWQNGSLTEGNHSTLEAKDSHAEVLKKEKSTALKGATTETTSESQTIENETIKSNKSATNKENLQSKTTSSTTSTFNKSGNIPNRNVVTEVSPIATPNSNNTTNLPVNKENIIQQINTNNDLLLNEKVVPAETSIIQQNSELKPPTPISLSPQIATLEAELSSPVADAGELNITAAKKLKFSLSANTGISFINRGLASNIDSISSPEVLGLRRESETLLEAIHYGVRGKLTHKSGFSFSTGGQYTVLSERYDNNNLEIEADSIEGVIKRIIQLNGDTVDVIGLMPRTTSYDYEKQIYNRYKMIDIPFIVGFEGRMNEWSLGIQAGVFVNLSLKTSGQIRNTQTTDLNIGENQADIFKSKVGLSYYGGVYIRRALSQNLDITIVPHGRFFAKDFNVADYAVKQRYSLIGVEAGLSYRF